MSYDDEVRESAYEAAAGLDTSLGTNRVRMVAGAGMALDAIPPLTLKTEDGRFVKVERRLWGSDQRGNQYFAYVVVPDSEP